MFFGHLLAFAFDVRGARFLVAQLSGSGATTNPLPLGRQAMQLLAEIRPYLSTCCCDKNARDVVQCLIEKGPPECRDYILRHLEPHVQRVAMDPYGIGVLVGLVETQRDGDMLRVLLQYGEIARTELDQMGVCQLYTRGVQVYGFGPLVAVAMPISWELLSGWLAYRQHWHCRALLIALLAAVRKDGGYPELANEMKAALNDGPAGGGGANGSQH